MIRSFLVSLLTFHVNAQRLPLPKFLSLSALSELLYDDTLSPMGQLHSKRNTYGWSYCKSATEESILAYGWACTAWVLVNKNMDYIRCRGELDWEEQTSCPKK